MDIQPLATYNGLKRHFGLGRLHWCIQKTYARHDMELWKFRVIACWSQGGTWLSLQSRAFFYKVGW